eukprot:gene6490-10498_t
MATVSQELTYQILAPYSKFNVTRPKVQYGGAKFSLEKGNVRNKNSYKYSVLARDETVSFKLDSKGNFIVEQKDSANKHKPNKLYTQQVVKKKGFNKRGVTLVKLSGARPDLKSAGVVKAARVHRGQSKKVKSVEKK